MGGNGGKGCEGEGVNVSFLVLKTTTSSTLCFFCLLGTITNFVWSPDTYCCYYNSNPFLNMVHLKKNFLFKQQLYQSEDFFTVLSPDTVKLKVLSVLELLSTFSVHYPSITGQIWYTRTGRWETFIWNTRFDTICTIWLTLKT